MRATYKDLYYDMLIKRFVYHKRAGVLYYKAPNSWRPELARRSMYNDSMLGPYFIVSELQDG